MYTLIFSIPRVNALYILEPCFKFEAFVPDFNPTYLSKGILRYDKTFDTWEECLTYSRKLAMDLKKNLKLFEDYEENARLIRLLDRFVEKSFHCESKSLSLSLCCDEMSNIDVELSVFETTTKVNFSFYFTEEEYKIYQRTSVSVKELKDAVVACLKKSQR